MSAETAAPPRADYRLRLHRRRKLVNAVALVLSLAAMAFGIVWLIWILWDTLTLGFKGLSWQVLTESTPPPNAEEGGLGNAIVGSLIMVMSATALATPIGILAGIYLAEYGQRGGWFAQATRFINDILLSAPSIVIGLFVYAVVVAEGADVLRLRGGAGPGADRRSRRRAHDREHAQPDSQRVARGGRGARARPSG